MAQSGGHAGTDVAEKVMGLGGRWCGRAAPGAPLWRLGVSNPTVPFEAASVPFIYVKC